jgi:hypothetical protein
MVRSWTQENYPDRKNPVYPSTKKLIGVQRRGRIPALKQKWESSKTRWVVLSQGRYAAECLLTVLDHLRALSKFNFMPIQAMQELEMEHTNELPVFSTVCRECGLWITVLRRAGPWPFMQHIWCIPQEYDYMVLLCPFDSTTATLFGTVFQAYIEYSICFSCFTVCRHDMTFRSHQDAKTSGDLLSF